MITAISSDRVFTGEQTLEDHAVLVDGAMIRDVVPRAAVTGDSGLNQPESDAPSDPFGDDAFIFKQYMCEDGATCDTPFAPPAEMESPVAHGCALSASRDNGAWWSLILALGLAARVRRWRIFRAC